MASSTSNPGHAQRNLDEWLNKTYAQVDGMMSASSISTMATADNLPGAGRTLGNLISFLGRHLEAAAGRFAARRGRRHSGAINEHTAMQLYRVDGMVSVSSVSTMATADDLPGAGRTLGKLYSFLGRHLETVATRFAVTHGYGPVAIKERIVMQQHVQYQIPSSCGSRRVFIFTFVPFPGSTEDKKLTKEVERLLKYINSDVTNNQELALHAILDLTVADVYIHHILLRLNAVKKVARVCRQAERDGCDHLLSPSRRALTCLIEVEINALGRRAYALVKARALREANATVRELIDRAYNLPDVSFLVMRHLRALFSAYSYGGSSGVPTHLPRYFLQVAKHAPHAIEWNNFQILASQYIMPSYFWASRDVKEYIQIISELRLVLQTYAPRTVVLDRAQKKYVERKKRKQEKLRRKSLKAK